MNNGERKLSLPGSGTVLTYGILSIFLSVPLVFCCPIGLIFALLGISKGNKTKRLYLNNPDKYVDYNQLSIGLVLSYIGLVVSIIVFLIFVLFFSPMIGWLFALLKMN
ncbi:hypothetical protein [uncultured Croceitalea sp.]|uniref:hypothetical protein n=1 Tax=uncultured Croceitalea sp. TaxID=1798908 RepID=UPI003305F8C3